jgi:hypothetical protein
MEIVGLRRPESPTGTISLPILKLPNIFSHMEALLTGGRTGVGARTVTLIVNVLCCEEILLEIMY